jgi:hypothetical protein
MSEAAAKETKATAYLAGIQRDQYELRQRVEAFMVQSLKLPAVNPGEIGFFNKIGGSLFSRNCSTSVLIRSNIGRRSICRCV